VKDFKQHTKHNQRSNSMYTDCQKKLHTFIFLFPMSMLMCFDQHFDYMATGVYCTMSGQFDPISVNYFDQTSLCNFRMSISCIGIMKTDLSRNNFLYTLLMKKPTSLSTCLGCLKIRQLNLFEHLLLASVSLASLDRWIGTDVLSFTWSSVIM